MYSIAIFRGERIFNNAIGTSHIMYSIAIFKGERIFCKSVGADSETTYGDKINRMALEERTTGRCWTRRLITDKHGVDLLQRKPVILHLDHLFTWYIKCTTHLYITNILCRNYIQPISFQLLVMYPVLVDITISYTASCYMVFDLA